MHDVATILKTTQAILLDFDGPICDLFSAYPAAAIAEELKDSLEGSGLRLPVDICGTTNPLHLLRWLSKNEPNYLDNADSDLRRAEIRAAASANPATAANRVIERSFHSGRQLIVVSNNSEPAITHYLNQHSLAQYVAGIVSRQRGRIDRLKPDPYPVFRAIELSERESEYCIFIGDEASDMEAAQRAHIPGIGLAKRRNRVGELSEAGATIVIETMEDIARSL